MDRETRREALRDLKKASDNDLIQLGLQLKAQELQGTLPQEEVQEHLSLITKVLEERGRTLDFNNIHTNII